MTDFVQRLTSRKFLLAVAGAIAALAAHQYPVAATIVLGYLTTEGIIDYKSAQKGAVIASKVAATAVTVEDLLKALEAIQTLQNAAPPQPPPGRVGGARTRRTTGTK